jgi:hypothetical protein
MPGIAITDISHGFAQLRIRFAAKICLTVERTVEISLLDEREKAKI